MIMWGLSILNLIELKTMYSVHILILLLLLLLLSMVVLHLHSYTVYIMHTKKERILRGVRLLSCLPFHFLANHNFHSRNRQWS